MSWASSYIGIPFSNEGATREGCNCWGLVCIVYKELFSINLNPYDTISAVQLLAVVKGLRGELSGFPWNNVQGRRMDFDVVLMRAESLPLHIAIAVGSDKLLHVEKGISSMCVKDDHPRYKHRIIGAYRHVAIKELNR